MDNEKKFKLDELPDAGSETQVPKPAPPPQKKSAPEPRVESLKKLDHGQRLDALGQRWYFEKTKRRWEWLYLLLILVVLQKTGFLLKMASPEFYVPAEDDYAHITFFKDELIFLLRYPLVLVILIPIFFKLKYPSVDHFEITFGGINTIREVDVPGNLPPTRVTVKWDDITEVKKGQAKGREVLLIHTSEGKAAEMIWDIDDIKKKVIAQVLKGLISQKNPFRQFIEKEII